jgi:hypothetical protein
LIIRACQGIRDISALRNNKKLSIYSCYNISLSTVNFENILYLATDLHLTYAATTTLKNAISLQLLQFGDSAVFLSSTVVSMEIGARWTIISLHPLEINLSNFSQLLKCVLLENLACTVDLTPLGNIEKVQLRFCGYVTVNGLGKNNKTVIIKFCPAITDLTALKTVPRVVIDHCDKFANCEDLNQVHSLKIVGVQRRMAFSGLRRAHRLELLECDKRVSFKGLDEVPFLKIISEQLLSLEGLGGKENKIIIIQAKYESVAERFLPKNCYSKTF